MAVFLTRNSPGLRTSPVERGYWVVLRLARREHPAPPAEVPELPNDEAKLGELTLRETLARHRDNKTCAGCHDRFDAIGLAFEGYGPVGERRVTTSAAGPSTPAPRSPAAAKGPVSTACAPTSGARQADFVDNLCRKLLAYGLGRGLQLSDDATIEAMRPALGQRLPLRQLGRVHRHQPAVPEQASRRPHRGGMKTMSDRAAEANPISPGVPANVPPRRRRHDGPAVARIGPRLGRRPMAGDVPGALPEAVRRPVHGLRHQPDHWWAKGSGATWSWASASSRWLPLKTKINVVNGLFNKHATGVGIHPGQTGNILSGAALQKGAELKGGISVDQVLASHLGEETVQPSMVLGCEQPITGYHETNFSMAYSSHISWQNATSPVPMEVYPSLAFDSLFDNRGSQRNQSILDRVRDEAASLSRQVSSGDRAKLDEYLDQRPRGRKPRRADAGREGHGRRRAEGPGPARADDAAARQRPARGHPRAHAADVRHRRPRLPDRQDPRRHAAALPRHLRPLLPLPRRPLGPPLRLARRPVRRLRADHALLRQPARLPRRPARRHERGRRHGARQLLPDVHQHCGPAASTTPARCRSSWPAAWAGRCRPAACSTTPDKGDDNRKLCSLYLSLMDRMGVKLDRFGDADTRLAEL